MTRFLSILAIVSLLVTACVAVEPIAGEDGYGISVVPVATLPRVKEGEKIASEAITALTDGQAKLAADLGNAEVEAAARAAEQQKRLDEAVLEAKDQAQIDWTTVILAALGVTGLGTVCTTAASRKRRGVSLLTGKPRQATPTA